MANIFNPKDNEELIARIEKLQLDSPALWGKMKVDQMISHCIAPIDIAFGAQSIKVPFWMGLLGRMMKNKWLNAPQFQKNSPTAKEFIRAKEYDFEETKQELITKTRKFQEGPSVIQLEIHPFWGKLSTEDWNNLQWKHLDHHLRQFGV